jgi:hypothetical protein
MYASDPKAIWRAQKKGDRPGLPPLVASVPNRPYLLRITKRQCDKPRGIAHLHPHQDLVPALRFGLAQCLADIAGICNGLTANLEDNVPDVKALLGSRAIWFDRGDDNTLPACARYFTRRRYLQSEVLHATGWLGVVIFGACPVRLESAPVSP